MEMNAQSCLQSGFTEPIRDNLWGHVYLTPALKALTESAPFMRLHRIMQLGPAFRVYPGATHSRAGHSLGVYHLARRLLVCLAEQGADRWLTNEGVFSFLCAGLLHDLGHFPYTHSLKELPLEDHETLTAKSIEAEPLRSLVAAVGADPAFTAAIVDTRRKEGGKELLFYRKLLSGVLDPDKLDYLSRDALYCGVPYGAQDVDFIFSRLKPHEDRGVDIDSKGIPSVESILFSKYLMYRAVYWHRSVRSATAMIKKALLAYLESGLIAGEELYHLDDQGLFSLMESRSGPLFSLARMVRDGKLYEAAAEIPFDSLLAFGKIQDRSEHEKGLASALSQGLGKSIPPEKLIIDIPEPISFESDLFVTDEGTFFGRSSSAFRPEMVDAFVKSLRVIRIFIDPEITAKLPTGREAAGILQITKKWLQLL